MGQRNGEKIIKQPSYINGNLEFERNHAKAFTKSKSESRNFSKDMSETSTEEFNKKRRNSNPLTRLQKFLDLLFRKLGFIVALYPSYFILFPIFLTLLGITGFQQLRPEDNPEVLFYPANGLAPSERAVFEAHFPTNFSYNFLPHHMTRASGFARILVSPKDHDTVFRQFFWRDLKVIDEIVQSIKVEYKSREYNYEDLCAKWYQNCYDNRILNLEPLIEMIENGTYYVNYPIMLYPLILPMDFGGLEVDEENGIITSASAANLAYFLKQNTKMERELAMLWEQKFLNVMKELDLNSTEFAYFAARSRKDEMLNNTNSIRPYSVATAAIMIIFSIFSVMTTDWVRGKMLLGLVGVLSAGMGTGAAFGALMYLGVPFISINKIIPFLMIGIGIDDMFVVLASWRRTRIQDPVPKRLADTYCEAGISITITSLTNMLSFSVGILTPILGVQIFCIYTTLSVLLVYLWHLTFFGGCLSLAGVFESQQRHCITFKKIKPKSQEEIDGPTCHSFWCSGGADPNQWNEKDNQPHMVMVLFRDYFGKFLCVPVVKVAVLFAFLIYLSGAIYGCLNLKEGLDRKHVVQYDSYAVKYYNKEKSEFRKFPYVIQVAITGNITYSDPETKDSLLHLHDQFESLPSTAREKILTQSWIRKWYQYIDKKPRIKAKIFDEASFIKRLRNYLSGPMNQLAFDVEFDDTFTRITAARITFWTYEITDTTKEVEMVQSFRSLAKNSPFNVTVFNPNFILFDQYTMVRPITIQAVSIAVVAMIIVSLIFIPNPWCSLLVGVSIVSIELGVVGYMSLWGVNLDQISMINLIMCIGFSVDFSAHISYAFLTAKVKTSEERVRECLFSLGLPIVQGGLSTIFCIITFVLAPSYVYVTFFKIVFLVVILATIHGLFLIPVLLSMFGHRDTTAVTETIVNASINIPRVKLDMSHKNGGANGAGGLNEVYKNGLSHKIEINQKIDELKNGQVKNSENFTKIVTNQPNGHVTDDFHRHVTDESHGHVNENFNEHVTDNSLYNKLNSDPKSKKYNWDLKTKNSDNAEPKPKKSENWDSKAKLHEGWDSRELKSKQENWSLHQKIASITRPDPEGCSNRSFGKENEKTADTIINEIQER